MDGKGSTDTAGAILYVLHEQSSSHLNLQSIQGESIQDGRKLLRRFGNLGCLEGLRNRRAWNIGASPNDESRLPARTEVSTMPSDLSTLDTTHRTGVCGLEMAIVVSLSFMPMYVVLRDEMHSLYLPR